jgi:hypothetical protein
MVQTFYPRGIVTLIRQEGKDGSGTLSWNKAPTNTPMTTTTITMTQGGSLVNIPNVREVERILQTLIQGQTPG